MANTSQTNQVNKIYSISLKGIDTANAEAAKLVKNFEALTAAKKELNAVKGNIVDPVELAKVVAQLRELDLQQQSVIKNMRGTTDEVDRQTGAYLSLVDQYKKANDTAIALAESLGKQSAEYQTASAAAEAYREKIAQINAEAKASTVTPAAAPGATIPGAGPATAGVVAGVTAGTAADETERLRTEQTLLAEATDSATAATLTQTQALQANLVEQIETDIALKANREEQKNIFAAIKETGAATDEQKERLVTLRGEQVNLTEANKNYTLQIRNLTKEIVAQDGSLGEQQALLNRLQADYKNAGEAFRESVGGQQQLAQIQALNAQVIILEQSIGRFGRTVGNYPQIFQQAFFPLEKELDTVKAKLAAGGLGEKEVADLTTKQNALNAVLAVGAKEFQSTTAQANAYKEANRGLGLAYGVNSEVFKTFTQGLAKGNDQLAAVDKNIKSASDNSSKLGKGLSGAYGGLKLIANILPGLGIAGAIGLLLIPIEALGSKLFEAASSFSGLGKAAEENATKLKISNQSIEDAKSKAADAALNISNLRIAIDAAKNGFANKDVVLKQYNTTIGETTGKVTSLDQAEQQLTKNAEAFIQFTLLKAAAQEAQKKSADKLVEATIESQKQLSEFNNSIVDRTISGGGAGGFGTGAFNPAEEARREKEAEKAEAVRQKKIVDAKNKEKATFDSVAKELFDKAQAIAKQYNFSVILDTTKDIKPHADALNVAEQNALKEIEANRLRLLAIENDSTNQIQKVRQLSYQEEIAHLNAVLKINVDALNAKQALINRDKTLNTEQARSIAEFGEQRSSLELQTSQKIQAIHKKEFDDINKNLEAELKTQILVIQNATKEAEANPALNNQDKALIKADANNRILLAEQKYLFDLKKLDDDFNKEAISRARLDAEKTAEAVRQGRALIAQAQVKDIQTEGEALTNAINIAYSKQIQVILENEQLSVDKKKELISRLSKSENITVLSNELVTLTKQVAEEKKQLDDNLISNEEYLATLKKQQKKAEELQTATTVNTTSKNPIAALFGFKSGSNEEKGVAEVAQAAFSLATDAMNGYFDAERDRIQASLKLAEDRIEADRKVALGQAQSQAEQDSLNKQFDAKKLAAEKAAFEQTKKIKKAEARIAFATEIANIFSTAYQLGPIAGPIVGAVLAGLATVRLGVNLSRIDKEQFAYGGQVPTKGGRFGGKPHSQGGTDFNYQGNTYNAEVDELAVIRTRNAAKNKNYTISGNHTQIASMLNQLGGGVPFAPGAKLRRFEFGGNLGESLQAPAFSVGIGGSLELLAEGVAKLDSKTDAINNRIDRLKVVQQTSTVTDAQSRENNQKNVAVL